MQKRPASSATTFAIVPTGRLLVLAAFAGSLLAVAPGSARTSFPNANALGGSVANMQIETITGSVAVRPDAVIEYRNFVSSSGPDEATSVVFESVLPNQTSFVSLRHPTDYTCSSPVVGGTGTVRCTRPTLRRFVGNEVAVVVRVPAVIAAGTILRATSTVSASEFDPDPANNVAPSVNRVTTGAEVADLEVFASGAPDPAAPGSLVRYTVAVTNRGPDTATGLQVFGRVLTGTDLVTRATPPPDWRCLYSFPFGGVPPPGDGTTVQCLGPILHAGETEQFSVVFRLSPFARSDVEFWASVGSETSDPNRVNNARVVITRIGIGEGVAVPTLGPTSLVLLALLLAGLGARVHTRLRTL